MGGPEQRKHKRVKFRKNITLNQGAGARSTSLSEGGMFVLTNQALGPNSTISITVPLEKETLSIQGVVRHFYNDVGAGIMFVNPTEEQQALLKKFIEAATQTQPTPAPAILVADDNDAKRKSYAEALRQAGYSVFEAATDTDALSQIAANQVAAVVFDPFMPNGFFLLQKIRALPSGRTILPIVLTSRAIPDMKKKAHLAAVREILIKMSTPPLRLLQIVEKHFPLG
ncbi:MAG TPA: PilZ domain-containing protein [Dissulfurispiraceae bacterium]|nr:PilZ domain-containing protein [Dissulfurispiraceae bacterium]